MEKYDLGLTGPLQKTLEQLNVRVELATEADLKDYKNIRIEAIDADPAAFNMSDKKKADQERNKKDSEWVKELKEQIIVLSKCNSKTIGLVKGIPKGDNLWSINAVYLNEDFRKRVTGSNISEEMLKKVLDEIKIKGGAKVRLWVQSFRKNAISLYEKFGFKKFNPLLSPKRTLELSGNRPDSFIGWKVMELDLTTQQDKL
jgi:ribosomal protein S18 acetylase RimI-like enzyme